METIKIKYWPDAAHLTVNPNGSWIDLYTYEETVLHKGDFKIIPLGVAMKLPEGYEANFVPRSSTFKRWGVLQTNHYSVIDPTYCGNDRLCTISGQAAITVFSKSYTFLIFSASRKNPGSLSGATISI